MAEDTAMTESAVAKVFNVPELLEAIVLRLPPRTVLVVQRVSRAWKAVISASPKLQRALGFTASQPIGWKPRRHEVFFSVKSSAQEFCDTLDQYTKGPFYNPLFKFLCRRLKASDYDLEDEELRKTYARYGRRVAELSLEGKNDSLRLAFAMQPPVCKLKVTIGRFEEEDEDYFEDAYLFCDFDIEGVLEFWPKHTGYVTNETGVKIADVVDYLKKSPVLPSNSRNHVFFKMQAAKEEEA